MSSQPLTHTSRLGDLEFTNYLKSQPQTARLIFTLEQLLASHPVFYLSSLLLALKGKPLTQLSGSLEEEITKLEKGSSFLHRINNCLIARNNCITSIRKNLTKSIRSLALFPKEYGGESTEQVTDLTSEGYTGVEIEQTAEQALKALSELFIGLSRLREMTVYVIEQVHSWRVNLEEWAQRCQQVGEVRYYFEGEELYARLLHDTTFLWTSPLRNYIWLQVNQDPLLIRNVVHLQQRDEHTLLEKYFLEALAPKNETALDQYLRCFEMLGYKREPSVKNMYYEEELLIENYLKMEVRDDNDDNQREKEREKQREKERARPALAQRGWVFERKVNGRERLEQVVEKHQKRMNIIKPFSISNYAEKNSIALAYLTQLNPQQRTSTKTTPNKRISLPDPRPPSNSSYKSDPQPDRRQVKTDRSHSHKEEKGKSDMQNSTVMRGTFNSLLENPVIHEDPGQHAPETPKNQIGRQPSLKAVRFNSFLPDGQSPTEQIQVEENQTPLNLRNFFEVFRADTSKPARQQQKLTLEHKQQTIKQLLMKRNASLSLRKPKLALPAKPTSKAKSRQKDVLKNSYDQYNSVKDNNGEPAGGKSKSEAAKLVLPFLSLKAKSLPSDLVRPYILHLVSQQHATVRSFTDYNSKIIIDLLCDPLKHCILFDLISDTQQVFGQAVVSEGRGGRNGRLKYTIEFINVAVFQHFVAAVLRIGEELLSSTPCQEVSCPLRLDQLDLVSSHFIALFDQGLREGVDKFGSLAVLEKKLPSPSNTDLRERIYVITGGKGEVQLGDRMMGNYRALVFECRCLVLTSNFRLRAASLIKDSLKDYKTTAIGSLFVRLLARIMTRHHLKQLRESGQSNNSVVLKSPFVRSLMGGLLAELRGVIQGDSIAVTAFGTMSELLNYLTYKNHNKYFQLQLLTESRFMLRHQLVLAELNEEFSLELPLSATPHLYLLHNPHRKHITKLTSPSYPPAYLLPTTNPKLQLFVMTALEYQDQLIQDLNNYLAGFWKEKPAEEGINVPAVVLPNLSRANPPTRLRLYEGLQSLFPERQFYSSALLQCTNHWQSHYPQAVVQLPPPASLVLQFPLLLGIYECGSGCLMGGFVWEAAAT